MRAKVLNDHGERTYAVVLDSGDEVVSALTRFAESENLTATRFTAIGAFSDAVLGYYDWDNKQYEHIPVTEQVEVVSLIGDVALEGKRPRVHAHVVLGLRDGTARGGHLLEGRVRPTLEVILTESPNYMKREFDPDSGLALIRIGE
ncbi:MAG: PPC domain-containing DNA-binding protein [Vulcanimicrobiaceae bacterium]